MRRLLTTCPSCGGPLVVTELSCTVCDTVVRGTYTGCTFCRLSDDDLRFLELFVASRGNIKEMERESGLGYWTIRSHLDEVIAALQLQLHADDAPPAASAPEDVATRRREILAGVERGEIPIDEAERLLAALARK